LNQADEQVDQQSHDRLVHALSEFGSDDVMPDADCGRRYPERR
jgi:hypothetical protein